MNHMTNLEKLKKYIDGCDITYGVSDEFKFLVIFGKYAILNPLNHELVDQFNFEFYILYSTLSELEKNELLQHMKKIINHQ